MLAPLSPESEQSSFGSGKSLSLESEEEPGKYTSYSVGPRSSLDLWLNAPFSWSLDTISECPHSCLLPKESATLTLREHSPSPAPKRDYGFLKCPSPSPAKKHDFGFLASPSPSLDPQANLRAEELFSNSSKARSEFHINCPHVHLTVRTTRVLCVRDPFNTVSQLDPFHAETCARLDSFSTIQRLISFDLCSRLLS